MCPLETHKCIPLHCLPRGTWTAGTEKEQRGRKGKHPVGAVNLFCLFLDANSFLDLSFANLSSAVINLQELTVHFSRVKADTRQGMHPVGMDRLSTRNNKGCTKLLLPCTQWQQRPNPALSIWSTLELLGYVHLFICSWQQASICPRKHWNKHGFTGEKFCPGGVTPRLSEVLLLRKIKPIRKPPETRAVFYLLFPPLNISCYCSCSFLWVSTGLVGGAATTGRGFWEASGPLGHMKTSVLFLSQFPTINFQHISAGKVWLWW